MYYERYFGHKREELSMRKEYFILVPNNGISSSDDEGGKIDFQLTKKEQKRLEGLSYEAHLAEYNRIFNKRVIKNRFVTKLFSLFA